MRECKHRKIMTFFYHHNREPAPLWACCVCQEKFIPISQLLEAEKRIAEAEAKTIELEKELFILASDVSFCGFGHVTSGLQEKAKRIYGKLRESGGEG